MTFLQSGMSRVKALIAELLTARPIGTAIARAAGDYIPVPRFHLRIDTQNPFISPKTKAQLFFGLFESAELRLVQLHLLGRSPVVELGAGIGVVTAAIASKVQGRVPVIAVEANEWLLGTLRKNAAAHPNVRIVHGAIDYSGAASVTLQLGQTHIGSAIGKMSHNGTATAPAFRLSDILAAADIEEFALVCDIEGAELALLENDMAAMRRCRELVIELHPVTYGGRTHTPADVLTRLRAAGFDSVAEIGDVHYLRRF